MPGLLQSSLHITDFTRSPNHVSNSTTASPNVVPKLPGSFISTLLPAASASLAVQVLFGIPSILNQTELAYDLGGGVGYYVTLATAFLVPVLRRRLAQAESEAAQVDVPVSESRPITVKDLLKGLSLKDWNRRQLAVTGGTVMWAFRLSSYLFIRALKKGHDSRFTRTKHMPVRFAIFWFAQSIWVLLCSMPAIAVNSVPTEALNAISRKSPSKKGKEVATKPKGKPEEDTPEAKSTMTDKLGLIVFLSGFILETLADYQKNRWWAQKAKGIHNEDFITRGLWAKSQYPNYLGDILLNSGLAIFASGILIRQPVQSALGWNSTPGGYLKAILIPGLAPIFTAYTLLRLSGVPLSRRKYDRLYGGREDYNAWKESAGLLFPKLF
ncbi:hypothetical protein QBC37DRAFT_79454 [Rhypophila decipiens]|uniref:Steroid 5-alpha reductase C-terminal domain-containing protein n=1 Tax=Rhypophila decipiens TaxID=261697 RepID=A0AAN6XWR5_9PEZI|nr:hypothetical protein QBC37DRAFT_79454 [Rhypophila decipiens]